MPSTQPRASRQGEEPEATATAGPEAGTDPASGLTSGLLVQAMVELPAGWGVPPAGRPARTSAWLADLTPAKIAQVGLFDVAFPFRRDLSSAGTPIRLAGQAYARGVGLHSRCELAYDLDGKFQTFVALAGLDHAGGNRGNATLTIRGDGKALGKPVKLTAAVKPVLIRQSVAGVKTLTVLVDFGDDGIDVGDHVSLVQARLIKP